jgi:hypothetical protein
MLGSYAAHDHYKNLDQAKKACIRTPAPAVRDDNCGVDGHRTRYGLILIRGIVRYRGRNAMPSGSLLERR